MTHRRRERILSAARSYYHREGHLRPSSRAKENGYVLGAAIFGLRKLHTESPTSVPDDLRAGLDALDPGWVTPSPHGGYRAGAGRKPKGEGFFD